ncbi:MAG: hypothetical protein K1X64_19080 [Myxococcaceae bacterium]|nr:hypothetical protein [Myxococcaceae bacterium]
MKNLSRNRRLAACLLVFWGAAACDATLVAIYDGGVDAGNSVMGTGGGAGGGGGGAMLPNDDGGAMPSDAGLVTSVHFVQGAAGCQAIGIENDVNLGGYHTDRYGWNDDQCQRRTAALVRNNATDPGGSRGGYLRELTWKNGNTDITARGTNANGWNGWGYVVNHYGNSAALSKSRMGTFRTVLSGRHHAIHEFKLQMSPGGPVDVTVQWVFRTGVSHPIYAITYDATPAGPNAVNADTRAPYGELAFEGTAGAIGGIGWGDKYRFTTTGAGPLTVASSWEYTQANSVPYVRMWSQGSDAEMGAVQSQSWEQHVAGGDYGSGQLAASCWGKSSANKGANCSAAAQLMPLDWLWPFQLNQYELPFTNASHRLAWGSQYGAIGQTNVSAFGKTFSGYPRVSYSVFMTVGPKSAQTTLKQVEGLERILGATLTASEGTVVTSGPAGVGRGDTAVFSLAGYNPAFASWDVQTASNRATVTLDAKAGALEKPLLRFNGFTAAQLSKVTVDGQALAADTGYFATVDAPSQTVWLTLNGVVSGPAVVHIE